MESKVRGLPPLPSGKRPTNNFQLNTRKITIISQSNRYIQRISSYQKLINHYSISKDQKSKPFRVQSAKSNSRDSSLSRNNSISSNGSLSKQERSDSRKSERKNPNYDIKLRTSMPYVTAKSWSVYQIKQQKYIYGKRNFKKREIASLTKIMNLISILKLLEDNQLQASKIKVRVSRQASCIIGTTAQLKQDAIISVYDLYFGMMLPSGNDAAFQIAQIGGSILLMLKQKNVLDKSIIYDVNKLTEYYKSKNNSVLVYLGFMNKISKSFKMINSNFANPHGLSNTNNYSTADDVCKLVSESMKNQNFRDIVNTKNYQCTCKIFQNFQEKQNLCNQEILQKKQISFKWENTNKMLKQGWNGVKTGITPNAGPCLAASVKRFIGGKQYEFAIVVINSLSMQARWKEVDSILNWVIEHQLYI